MGNMFNNYPSGTTQADHDRAFNGSSGECAECGGTLEGSRYERLCEGCYEELEAEDAMSADQEEGEEDEDE